MAVQEFPRAVDETPRPAGPTVVSGAVIAYRLFDIAYAIDLVKAEALWRERTRAAHTRARLTTTPVKAVAFGVAPVEMLFDPVMLTTDSGPLRAEVTVRLYDFGAVTFALRLAADNRPWADFAALMDRTPAWTGTDIWAPLLEQVRTIFAAALIRPTVSTIEEDYLIGLVEAFDTPLSADDILARVDLVPLLSGERRQLSATARQEVMRHRFSYYTDDIVVLTWDRAFIYEPRGDSDVVDVLEVANAQLLEMRYYDELLDAELPRMYDLVEHTQRTKTLFASRRFAHLARRLSTLVAEVTELTERVDNALQVTEDVYLARIYATAVDLFRVPTVGAAVDRKLAIIRETYAALYQEASAARGALMEAVIVVLIAIEIVLALVHR